MKTPRGVPKKPNRPAADPDGVFEALTGQATKFHKDAKARGKHRLTIDLAPEIHAAFRSHCFQIETTMVAEVRRMIEGLLAQKAQKAQKAQNERK